MKSRKNSQEVLLAASMGIGAAENTAAKDSNAAVANARNAVQMKTAEMATSARKTLVILPKDVSTPQSQTAAL